MGKKRRLGAEQKEGNTAGMINHAQRWRLMSSPVEHNENHELELQGTWEPLCRCSALSLGEGESSQCFVSDGDKTNGG